jgi:hypothetical protein
MATYLLAAVSGLGPVDDRAFALQHSLGIYERALRDVAKRAHRGGRALEAAYRAARETGTEVRMNDAVWERTLRAAMAD